MRAHDPPHDPLLAGDLRGRARVAPLGAETDSLVVPDVDAGQRAGDAVAEQAEHRVERRRRGTLRGQLATDGLETLQAHERVRRVVRRDPQGGRLRLALGHHGGHRRTAGRRQRDEDHHVEEAVRVRGPHERSPPLLGRQDRDRREQQRRQRGPARTYAEGHPHHERDHGERHRLSRRAQVERVEEQDDRRSDHRGQGNARLERVRTDRADIGRRRPGQQKPADHEDGECVPDRPRRPRERQVGAPQCTGGRQGQQAQRRTGEGRQRRTQCEVGYVDEPVQLRPEAAAGEHGRGDERLCRVADPREQRADR